MRFIHLFIICQLAHGKKSWIKSNLVKIRPDWLKDLGMTELTHAIVLKRLEAGDSICLLDMKNLSYADLDKLFEDIKFWKIYGKSDFKLRIRYQKNEPKT
jgi:hypothetical protein